VRVTGPAAVEVAAPLIRSRKALASLESHRLTRVTVVDPGTGRAIDDALCAVMRAPRSYTGEDTVEISCHGGPALARMLVERLVGQGARLAEPGEFTRRAFLNGRLDLAQAEAVALLISARTERAVTLAARGIAGDLSKRLWALRQGLLEVVASLEVALDFPDDATAPDEHLVGKNISILQDESERLLSAARRGQVAHTGLTIAIVGPPNAGKSSLFNALLGRERAIVTPEAGTTRDVIEGTIVVSGVPIRLLDTAGIGAPRDHVDAEGMRRARHAVEESDILVVVVDGSSSSQGPDWRFMDDLPERPHITALSKSDLWHRAPGTTPAGVIPASVKIGGGLDALRSRLGIEVEQRSGADADESAIVATIRQIELLEALSNSIRQAGTALSIHPTEISLIELRAGLDAVSGLLGVEVGDSVLDTVFSRFCVGK